MAMTGARVTHNGANNNNKPSVGNRGSIIGNPAGRSHGTSGSSGSSGSSSSTNKTGNRSGRNRDDDTKSFITSWLLNIASSNFVLDTLLVVVMLVHLSMCPYTKVEESFNLQAMHDILYHQTDLDNYDHLEFPGVIPRSFIGALLVSTLSYPFVWLSQYYMLWNKLASQYVVRAVLGLLGIASLSFMRRSIARQFGRDTAVVFTLVLLSQFHLLFYLSRPLPNIFALALVTLAYGCWLRDKYSSMVALLTVSIFVFRSEVLVLAGPVVLALLVTRRLSFLRFVLIGAITAALAIGVSVLVDSYFWRRTLYPEMEVFLFNTVENRSHEWGTMPWHWYFSSALPRALLLWFPVGLIAPVIVERRRLTPFILPTLLFIILYSFLPHKELRFIIYVLPILSMSASVLIAKVFRQLGKGTMYKLMALGFVAAIVANATISAGFLYVSSLNYPGGHAFTRLHQVESGRLDQPLNVHIDNLAAITGVSRFGQLSSKWTYSKKERDVEYLDYDLLIAPNRTASEDGLGFNTKDSVSGFVKLQRTSSPPYIQVIQEEQLFILSKKPQQAIPVR
ncbi:hypothetical protein SAMD00019534_045480 [Acytostelium subglobosum LB1]|uniref:hypothetical protein n=1 Tax=Acytostelium subglobosum LB1 TaxID=1410327 RepID=UPI000644955B|nr:hypothetical protein SAMD00019534_045480 [Acytostelium subglobosum LB1]GAM21373.1 hypothetical protein SAMD00019534_045480 [Acytostelium subglobosum LB1]|eukprot:XP_012755492.1 hypothetical protein SAMD00019534_045480 [Acytostelium subglobosum LB1]